MIKATPIIINRTMPLATLVLSLILTLCTQTVLAQEEKRPFDIGASSVAEALKTFAIETDSEILFTADIVQGKTTQGLQGQYTDLEALEMILANTGLNISQSDDDVYMIRAGDDQETSASAGLDTQGGAEKKLEMARRIDEMVVTANKREQSLQDTAMSVSALSGGMIDRRGLVGMGDYLGTLPGISVLDQGPGYNSVVIRGLTADPQLEGLNTSPLTGVYFGETVISGFGVQGNSADIKLVDMQRVEVLRGPQGTLYGAGALGGVVRNIPNAPNLGEFEGSLKLGYSGTSGEGGSNNSVQAVINLPIVEDTFAVRVVAYRFDDSGYYRNIAASDALYSDAATTFSARAIDQDNIGETETTGGRISALWEPSDELSVSLSYLNQRIDQNGWGQTDFDAEGSFSQRRLGLRTSTAAPNYGSLGDQEGFEDDIEITNFTIEYDLGWASLVSSASWVDETAFLNRDLSAFFATSGYYPWHQPQTWSSELFSEEIRLSSNLDGPFQFLLGYYYEEKDRIQDNFGLFAGDNLALNSFAPGEILMLRNIFDRSIEQQAVFGELSYDLNDKTTFVFGGRAFDYDQTQGEQAFDAAFSADSISEASGSESDISLKAGVEYRPDDTSLMFVTWSEGFRLGYPVTAESLPVCDQDNDGFYDGSNGISTGERTVDSDFVENFEIGGKFSLLDNRLNLNATVYQADWDGIPILTIFDFCNATSNAGTAQSRGVEVELSYLLNDQLSVDFSTSYVNAELTEDAPALSAESGDRLPGAPKYNASIGLEYSFVLGSTDAFIRTDYAYVGGFYNNVQETGTEAGDYHKVNLKMGASFDQFDLSIYVNNLTDDDSVTWIDSEFPVERGNRLQPRTVGLNLGYQF